MTSLTGTIAAPDDTTAVQVLADVPATRPAARPGLAVVTRRSVPR